MMIWRFFPAAAAVALLIGSSVVMAQSSDPSSPRARTNRVMPQSSQTAQEPVAAAPAASPPGTPTPGLYGDCTPGVGQPIQCYTWDWTVSGTASVLLQCQNIGGLVKATGGGTVPIVLPDAPCRGRGSIFNLMNDGKTTFTLQVQTPSLTKISGPVPVNGVVPSVITVAPGHAAWAQFGDPNTWNIGTQ